MCKHPVVRGPRSSHVPIRLLLARALCSRMPPVGAQRLRDVIYPLSAARADDYRFTVCAQTGSPYTGSTADFHGYPFAVHGYYNWRNVAIAHAVCRPGDTIVEVGANVGTETVSFSDLVGEQGTVHAFEPFPANVECLRRNAAQTRYRNISIYPVALSDRQGKVRFAVPLATNSGTGHVIDSALKTSATRTNEQSVEVACETLDSLSTKIGGARLLAIDAEGHEVAILKGALRYLSSYKPAIIVEVVDDLLAPSGGQPEDVAHELRPLGYELFEIRRFGTRPIRADTHDVPRRGDWLALPDSNREGIRRINRTLERCAIMPMTLGLNPLRAPT